MVVRIAAARHLPQTPTSLRDPVAYPAAEVVALYKERWELELSFDPVTFSP